MGNENTSAIIESIRRAAVALNLLGIDNPSKDQIESYADYERTSEQIKKPKESSASRREYLEGLVCRKIRFYTEIGLEDRAKKLSTQLKNVWDCRCKYSSPEHAEIRSLGLEVLKVISTYRERAANFLAYLATEDERFGKNEVATLSARATSYWGESTRIWGADRELRIKDIVDILKSCHTLGKLSLDEITLGTSLSKKMSWKKTKEGYKKARSFSRAIENSYDGEFNRKNREYSDFVKPYHQDNFQYWEKPLLESWQRNKRGLEEFSPANL